MLKTNFENILREVLSLGSNYQELFHLFQQEICSLKNALECSVCVSVIEINTWESSKSLSQHISSTISLWTENQVWVRAETGVQHQCQDRFLTSRDFWLLLPAYDWCALGWTCYMTWWKKNYSEAQEKLSDVIACKKDENKVILQSTLF